MCAIESVGAGDGHVCFAGKVVSIVSGKLSVAATIPIILYWIKGLTVRERAANTEKDNKGHDRPFELFHTKLFV